MSSSSSSSSPPSLLLLFLFLFFFFLAHHHVSSSPVASNFNDNFMVSWAPRNVKFLGSGDSLQLLLDQNTGSGFASKDSYLFGSIHMQIKLIPGDSAGTVTAYYMSSETDRHDELDFEFLGNTSGKPYLLQTNVFSGGVGGREQRIYLWFDPTADFHTYSVTWTAKRVVFLVDGLPIRVFSNNAAAAAGVPYLARQPMRVFSSVWNGDSWATRGGLDKIDWSHAPFVATYRNFRADACIPGKTNAKTNSKTNAKTNDKVSTCLTSTHALASNAFDRSKLQWVKSKFMVYDYCTDRPRYPRAPAECGREF